MADAGVARILASPGGSMRVAAHGVVERVRAGAVS
jgi:hypothetical protein